MHHHLLTIFMLKCVCLCVSRAQKKNYFYVFREISHEHRTELFFSSTSSSKLTKREIFPSLVVVVARSIKNVCEGKFLQFFFLYFVEKLPLSVVRRCCCFCCHIILYMSNFVCEKRRKSNDDDRNWKSTKNARDRLMFMCSLCVYIWLGSVVLEREVWRRRSTTIGDFNMKHFSNS